MKPIGNQNARPSTTRLRFKFDDRVVTRDIPAGATYAVIASTLSELSTRHYGSPIAIYATFEATPRRGLLH